MFNNFIDWLVSYFSLVVPDDAVLANEYAVSIADPLMAPEAPRAKGSPARSSAWPTVEKRWIATHPKCEACGRTKNLNVHHKMPFHLKPELELDESNLITLCRKGPGLDCHLAMGHIGNWSNYNPEVVTDAACQLITVSHCVKGSGGGQ